MQATRNSQSGLVTILNTLEHLVAPLLVAELLDPRLEGAGDLRIDDIDVLLAEVRNTKGLVQLREVEVG